MSNSNYDKIFEKLLIYIPLICTFFVYVLIFIGLDRGTSVDEGYYLLSYLPEQPINSGVSQFFYIVRSLFGWLPEDNALMLRYIRFFLTLASLIFLAYGSLKYLDIHFNLRISPGLFYSLVLLTGALSYCFASPMLYYDSMQAILYFIVFGLLFLSFGKHKFNLLITHLFSGFFIVFAVFNYLPSGLALAGSYMLFLFLNNSDLRISIRNTLILLLGIGLGLLVYHLFIHDIPNTLNIIQDSFISAQKGITKHDNASLITKALFYFIELFAVFAVFIVVSLFYFYLLEKTSKRSFKNVIQIVFALSFLFLISQRSLFLVYRSNLLILPIAFLLANFLTSRLKGNKFAISFSNVITFLFFIVLPFIGVFGTNQSISAKALFFTPFWILAFVVLLSFKKPNQQISYTSIFLCLVITLSCYFHIGYFTRFHYYYTPRSSKYEISGNKRFKSILVSKWQKEFHEKAIKKLEENGYTSGTPILAFYDNFLTVYMVGGYIPDNLIYQFEVFASDKKNIPSEKLDYILIIQEQEKPMAEFLKNTNWNFPNGYERYDLGLAAQNLPNEGYNSILFVRKGICPIN